MYNQFVKERLDRHSNQLPLKDAIPKSFSKVLKSLSNKNQTTIKPSEANNMCLRFVEVASDRGFALNDIICTEMVAVPFFLFTGDGFMKPSHKSELAQCLKKYGKEILHVDKSTEVTVFDFMPQVRKLPIKKMQMHTMGELVSTLCTNMSNAAADSKHVHIIFDNYFQKSAKNQEHLRRSAGKNYSTVIFKESEKLSSDMRSLWSSTANKIAL